MTKIPPPPVLCKPNPNPSLLCIKLLHRCISVMHSGAMPRRQITIPNPIFDELERLALVEGVPTSYLAKKAIQAFLKNPILGSLAPALRTLPPKPTDIQKFPDGTISRLEGNIRVWYKNGLEISRETISSSLGETE